MFCPSCGTRNNEDSLTCTNCKANLKNNIKDEKMIEEYVQKKSNSYLIISLIMPVLSIISVILFKFSYYIAVIFSIIGTFISLKGRFKNEKLSNISGLINYIILIIGITIICIGYIKDMFK